MLSFPMHERHPSPQLRLLAASLLIALMHAGCAARVTTSLHSFIAPCMGGQVRIVLYAPTDAAAEHAAAAALARLEVLEEVMSDYRPASELMRLSATSGQAVPVSDDLFRVLARSIEIARASNGAFDPAIGPVVRLWRTARRTGELPPQSAIDEARGRSGHEHLELDARARTVTLHRAHMQLDLGGIGKGFGADEALRTLRAHGITSALVDLGGDIAIGDPPPNETGWRIAFDPRPGDASADMCTLSNVGVATSSDQVQFIELGGVRYSHIVDPRTGLGVTHRTAVVVIAPDAATADALASAISVIGPGDAPEAADLSALLAKFRASVLIRREPHEQAVRACLTRQPD